MYHSMVTGAGSHEQCHACVHAVDYRTPRKTILNVSAIPSDTRTRCLTLQNVVNAQISGAKHASTNGDVRDNTAKSNMCIHLLLGA